MFKFGRKDKKDDKKERRDSKKDKKRKENTVIEHAANEGDEERYAPLKYPPPVAPKPSRSSQSSVLNVTLNKSSGSPLINRPRGILKFRSSGKSKHRDSANYDDSAQAQENARRNEAPVQRLPPDTANSNQHDRRKRESIHSITMNISPPSVPPPPSPIEKVYSANLKLPDIVMLQPAAPRELVIRRQPKGDFGINLRWAPYYFSDEDSSLSVAFAEPGSSGHISGVVHGDRIVEINGSNVERSSKESVINLIQHCDDQLRLKVQQIPEMSEFWQHMLKSTSEEGDESRDTYINGHRHETMWLVHRGGYSLCTLVTLNSSNAIEGRCQVKLEPGDEVIEVDENDLEKTNPSRIEQCQQLSSLVYLNESSILHVLRQRYGNNRLYTFAGDNLIVLNPRYVPSIYSQRVMQMMTGSKPADMAPHVFSKAQLVYRTLLSSSRDQSIVLMGHTGSGKTTSLRHILSFYALSYGGIHCVSLDEKLHAASVLLEAFGNCHTTHNKNASRFSQLATLDFDNYGRLTAAFFQILMLEKSRVVRQPDGELSFHVFNYVLHGSDSDTRKDLYLHHVPHNKYFNGSQNFGKEAAINGWLKLENAMRVLAVTPEESKVLMQVLAAIIHLGAAGIVRGGNDKAYFSDPASAQNAAKMLGVTMEDLSKSVLNLSPLSSSRTNLSSPVDDPSMLAVDALEGVMIGLYTEVFGVVVSLINRSLSSVTRSPSSITVLDLPGMKVDDTVAASFDDLCYNYVNERVQSLFHEKVFTENLERYNQENIEFDLDPIQTSPDAVITLLDKCTNQHLLQSSSSSRIDLSMLTLDNDPGILWLLDECSITPGATEQNFISKLVKIHAASGRNSASRPLLYDSSRPSMFMLSHCQGTFRVTYCAQGWIKACRDCPSTKLAAGLLVNSNLSNTADVFGVMRGSMTSSFGGASGRSGNTLRRGTSLRRTVVNQAGIKRQSLAVSTKFQTDSLLDAVSKTGVHFIQHLVPCKRESTKLNNTDVGSTSLDVPFIRAQVRALEILPAIRYHRQGFPEHMPFNDFLTRYSVLSEDKSSVPVDRQKFAIEELFSHVDVDQSSYRIGLSQVFFRSSALTQLDRERELKRSLYAVTIQKHVRRHLAEKALSRLKLKHEAMRCLQKNIRIHFKLRDWPWWKLYTKIKPVLNVQKAAEDLLDREREVEELKARLAKAEKERNLYKQDCAKLEDELAIVQSDYNQEKATAGKAAELLEHETSKRLMLESQVDDYQSRLDERESNIAKLSKELDNLKSVNLSYRQYDHRDDVDGTNVSLFKYEQMIHEQEHKRKQLQSSLERQLEELKDTKHKCDRQINELSLENDDLHQQVQSLKKKVQKYVEETQDVKRQYEEALAKCSGLEKKQKKFDNELYSKAGNVMEERAAKETLQRERDQLLKQKYTLTQELEDVTIERDALQSKLRRLEHEVTELRSSGSAGDVDIIQLRTAKHELERKIAEQEDEICDMQQEIHELEMAKLRLQIEVDKLKQKSQKDMEQQEREIDELRESSARKNRNYENRINELEEELDDALQGKRDAERRLLERRDAPPVRDHEHEKELKNTIRKLRALLSDMQSQLDKYKDQGNTKSQVRALELQIEDIQASLTAALKTKQSLETELHESQQQVNTANRAKMEAEDKLAKVTREKTDIENEKEDLDEEIHELVKRYQALISQSTATAITVRDQAEQLASFDEDRRRQQEEIDMLTSKLSHIDRHYLPKEKVTVLESKCLELEQKLDYEKCLRIRFENLSNRIKDNAEKLEDEMSKLQSKIMDEERKSKQLQSQLSRALEAQDEVQKKEIEHQQTISALTNKIEFCDGEIHRLETELRSANKRVEYLQSALEQSAISDYDAEAGTPPDSNRDGDISSESDSDEFS